MAQLISSPPASSTRYAYLDGVRALAALYVVLNHIYLHIWPLELGKTPPEGIAPWLTWLYHGHFAVTVFIVLSGFCLMLPVLKTGGSLQAGIGDFFRRRVRRILPSYYLAMALSLALLFTLIGESTGTHWDRSIGVTLQGFLVKAFLLQDVFPSGQINHVFWSIALEWHIYFLFPAFLWLWRRTGPAAAATLFLVGSYVLARAAFMAHLHLTSPHFIGMFALGALGAGIAYGTGANFESMRARLPWRKVALALWVAALGFVAWKGAAVKTDQADLLFGLAAVASLVGLSSAGKGLRSALEWKPLVMLGGFSFSLYLVHAPLIQVVWKYVVQPQGLSGIGQFALLVVLGIPLIVAASYAFFLLAEKPFMGRPKEKSKTHMPTKARTVLRVRVSAATERPASEAPQSGHPDESPAPTS